MRRVRILEMVLTALQSVLKISNTITLLAYARTAITTAFKDARVLVTLLDEAGVIYVRYVSKLQYQAQITM